MSEAPSPENNTSLRPALNSLAALLIVPAALIPLGLFLFSLLGRYFFLAELICNFRCQIMFALIPFVFLLFLVRYWWLGIVFSIATVWSMSGIVWIYLPANQPAPGSQTIRIMSFNVLAKNRDGQAVRDRIFENDPDVVTILEYANHWSDELLPLKETYPHQVLEPRWHGFGVALLSKYPLSETNVVQLTGQQMDNPMLVTSVNFNNQKLRLAALHLVSPTNRGRLKVRNQQLRETAKWLGKNPVPTVVMGDFNCTPWSPFLDNFLQTTGYRDSRQGFGYQATWHQALPGFRIPIDHAFVSDEIHVHDRYVGTRAGSDHLPIVFELSLEPLGPDEAIQPLEPSSETSTK